MRVFISHSSKDKPAVEALAKALRDRGFDPWYDTWMIAPGDDVVARMNEGLAEAQAGIIVLSSHWQDGPWVNRELGYLIHALAEEGKLLIPVLVDQDAYIPPLLRPIARCRIDEVDAIVGALRSERPVVPSGLAKSREGIERVVVTLSRPADGTGIIVTVRIGSQQYSSLSHEALPREVIRGHGEFLKGFRTGLRRSPAEAERVALETELASLGRGLRSLCLNDDSGAALTNLVDGAPISRTIEVCFESEDTELIGLPFEALRLPDDRLLAIQDRVVTFRRVLGLKVSQDRVLPGPIKVLVAVGAPDEETTRSVVLDHERELQNILDAVDVAQRHENFEVRILEVGHPDVIADAIKQDAYHVLHLSCHGGIGVLELETEDGTPYKTSAEDLIKAIRKAGQPLPLVFLNACHGAVGDGQAASLSMALLRAGIPAVLAMQTSVSDYYATELAREFYEELPRCKPLLVSRALAEARREVERQRREAISRGAPLGETQPEYATATLYLAGDEQPIANLLLKKEPLQDRPVYNVAGPVPQLRIDDLIGRRRELRETLRTLRDPNRQYAGVLLTGLGGVGKSALAGRAMQRLAENGWQIAAHVGRFDLGKIAVAIGGALRKAQRSEAKEVGTLLLQSNLSDAARLQFIGEVLAEDPLLLVLDDFEQNLNVGGDALLDPDLILFLEVLTQNSRRGRLLVTCRYPVPGSSRVFHEIPLGPLSLAETRKLVQRLPALREQETKDIARVLGAVGGHPRILEFLDGLLKGGQGRLTHVTKKLHKLATDSGIDLEKSSASVAAALPQALLLGMRDVLLEELVAIARERGDADALFQAAVSNVPVSPAGVAHMLADSPADAEATAKSLGRLAALSLVHQFPDEDVWVHRWTAQGLAQIDTVRQSDRQRRAGRYRLWRAQHESLDLGDAQEALRNFLAGKDFDMAAEVAVGCFGALRRLEQSVGIAALAAEVLECFPEDHPNFAPIADAEGKAHLALGLTDRAMTRYQQLLRIHQALAATEPIRADYQRQLSLSFSNVGNLYRALGNEMRALDSYQKSLAIAEQLAAAEPDRANYQRDLSVVYGRIGDLYLALSDGARAYDSFQKSVAITERLLVADPDRVDYQRDLMVTFNKIGDLHRKLDDAERAREAYLRAFEIISRLAMAQPDHVDYQRDLSVSFNKLGNLYQTLGDLERARDFLLKDLAISERLTAAEPDRADYQCDLVGSLVKLSVLSSPPDRLLLARALEILKTLDREGRLNPSEAPKIAVVEQLLSNGN